MNIAFQSHDHQNCASKRLAEARNYCEQHSLRLTDWREKVLRVLLTSHQAMGAYEVLEKLVAEGAAPQPTPIYRALTFLSEHGLVHKIESQNAYTACQFPGESHYAAFLICRQCKRVGETHIEVASLGEEFHIEDQIIEIRGLCPQCQ